MHEAIRTEILSIFERHRQTPDAAYDDSHFLHYLLAHPKGTRLIHNSFRGLRRYNAFIRDVQERFTVYLSLKDFEADYSLDQFTQRISELQSSRRSSLASFRSQVHRGFGWSTVVILSFFGITATCMLWPHWRGASLGTLLSVLAGNGWALKSYLHWRSYHKRLEVALSAAKQ